MRETDGSDCAYGPAVEPDPPMLTLLVREDMMMHPGAIQCVEVINAAGDLLGQLPAIRVEYVMEPAAFGRLNVTVLASNVHIEGQAA
jgi:hypothetical protein